MVLLRPISCALLAGAALGVGACGFDWDRYDPRLGSGVAGGAGLTGGGGSGGEIASGGTSGSGGVTAHGGAGGHGGDAATGGTGGTGGDVTTGGSAGLGGSGGSGGEIPTGGSGGSAATGGSGGSGGSGGGPCGSIDLLADDFDDGVPPVGWEIDVDGDLTIEETGGEVVVTLPTDGSEGYADANSRRFYDLRDRRFRIEVPTMASTATDVYVYAVVARDGENHAWVEQHHGTISFIVLVGGVEAALASLPYDPAAHRWWAIREQAGTMYFETSPDGVNFVTRASRLTGLLFPVESVEVTVGVYDPGSTSPGEVHFDNLQGGVAPMESHCPADSFSDDFDDGVPSHRWTARDWVDGNCTIGEQGGVLRLEHAGSLWESCGTVIAEAFDFTENAATIEVPQISMGGGADFYFWFWLGWDSGEGVEWEVNDGALSANYYLDHVGFTPFSMSYDAGAHRWWRIRMSAGRTYWETSSNGTSWTPRVDLPNPTPVTALDVELGVACAGNGCAPSTVTLDHYNLPP